MAELACTIKFDIGTLVRGSITVLPFTSSFELRMDGSEASITFTTDNLISDGAGLRSTCCFSSGTVTVVQNGSTVFTGRTGKGLISRAFLHGENIVGIHVSLLPSPPEVSDGNVSFTAQLHGDGPGLSMGFALVSVSTTPSSLLRKYRCRPVKARSMRKAKLG